MAQYEVTFSCGHTQTVDLVGKGPERQRRIENMQKFGDCRACAKAAANARVQIQADDCGLPALTGSEKQIAWANSIRFEKIQEIEAFFERYLAKVPAETLDAAKAEAATHKRLFAVPAEAKFWIEMKDTPAHAIMRRLHAEHGQA